MLYLLAYTINALGKGLGLGLELSIHILYSPSPFHKHQCKR